VLHGLQPYFEFINDDMTVTSIALAGGGAGSHFGSCGAFSGALMALSANFCPRAAEPSDEELAQLDRAPLKFYEFRDWFIETFGGVNCADVLQKLFGFSYKLNNEEERAQLRKIQQELGINCNLVVEKSAVKAAQILSGDD